MSSKIQATPIVGKFFLALKPLLYGTSWQRGQVIGRVDQSMYFAQIFDENGQPVGTMTLSARQMENWMWFDALPVAIIDPVTKAITINPKNGGSR